MYKDKVGLPKRKFVSPSKLGHELLPIHTPLTPLQKRARRKAVTRPLAVKLSDLTKSSLMKRAYDRTATQCGEKIVQFEGKLHTAYCGYRWCVVCSNIRTARAWASYGEEVNQFAQPRFVTLTVPSCAGSRLRPLIQKMHKQFHHCWKSIKRQGHEVRLVRATEVTYSEKLGKYHPHIHVLVDGHQVSVLLVKAWLKRWKDAHNAAQDIRVADKNSCYELFKYASKLMSDKKDVDGSRKPVPAFALDTIFGSIRGLRLWADVGLTSKLVRDTTEEGELQVDEGTSATKRVTETIDWVWQQGVYDWVSRQDAEVLSEYEPSEKVKNWIQKIEVMES